MELNNQLYRIIEEKCIKGDEFIKKGEVDKAIKCYHYAKELLPTPLYDWEAATWIFAALGDSYYLSCKYEEALYNFLEAQKCPAGIGNPFIVLRIGQCYFEMNDLKRAKEYLLQAYMVEGKEIFEDEPNKYYNVIKGEI